MMKKALFCVLVCILLLLSVIIPVTGSIGSEKESHLRSTSGNFLFVGGSGPGNYSTIQGAINAATNGDTVFVYDDSS
ncbi:MAG: hypothetical protein JXA75_04230, partial [Candidatus Thermoplasmatota archaeon]|nr:hypothetical protein [Candidatus Thermoplasmatota archaeon]